MASEENDFSDEFCQFLQSAIPAVEAAELLLAMRREPARWWTAGEALATLGPGVSLSEAEAGRYLDTLAGRGLAALGPDKRVQYRPGSETLAAHARTLDKVYRERPVTLIRVIYGLRDSKIQSFADAFNLRKK